MDLSNFDTVEAERGATLIVDNPVTGEALIDEASNEPVELELLGKDSTTYRERSHKVQTKRLNKSVRGGKFKVDQSGLEEDNLHMLVLCTVGWKHMVIDGEELEYSIMNARTLYERCPWLREQAEAFINERCNFMGNSHSGSSDTQSGGSNKTSQSASRRKPRSRVAADA